MNHPGWQPGTYPPAVSLDTPPCRLIPSPPFPGSIIITGEPRRSVSASSLITELLTGLGRPEAVDPARLSIVGADPVLPTRFPIGDAAVAVMMAGGLLVDAIWQARGGLPQRLSLRTDVAAASLLSFIHQRRIDLPAAARREDAAAGVMRFGNATTAMYRAGDGFWVHLHGGFPHLHAGTLALLGCDDGADAVAAAVARFEAQALEDALAERRLCAARIRTADEWRAHPQGQALRDVPVIEVRRIGDAPPRPLVAAPSRPLAGVRVLDFTRVLAGPTVGRTLASHGAQVLRVHGPHLPFIEPFAIDTGHGKRSTRLDLRQAHDLRSARALLGDAHVVTLGYRRGALSRFGFDAEQVAADRPGAIVVSVNAYGHTGPWADRGGWEQLAQSATGIAEEQGRAVGEGGVPALLPAAATDYLTGHLGALGALRALERQQREGGSFEVRVSLSRTAMWLQSMERIDGAPQGVDALALENAMTTTPDARGALRHLGPVLEMSDTPPRWAHTTAGFGEDDPTWSVETLG